MGPHTLDLPADLGWLKEVHGIDATGYAVVLVYGNNDSPSKVELYKEDHYQCKPVVWTAEDTGELRPEGWHRLG